MCFFREKAFLAQKGGSGRARGDRRLAYTARSASGTLAAPGIRIPVVLVSDTLARDGAPVRVDVDATWGAV